MGITKASLHNSIFFFNFHIYKHTFIIRLFNSKTYFFKNFPLNHEAMCEKKVFALKCVVLEKVRKYYLLERQNFASHGLFLGTTLYETMISFWRGASTFHLALGARFSPDTAPPTRNNVRKEFGKPVRRRV